MRRVKAGLLALLFVGCVLSLVAVSKTKLTRLTEQVEVVQEPFRKVSVKTLDWPNARNSSKGGDHTTTNGHADSSTVESPHEELQQVESENLANQKNNEIGEEKILQTEEGNPINLPSNEEKPPPVNTFSSRVTIAPPLQIRHNERQAAVVNTFKHAWMGYTQYAWGKDELLPITRTSTNTYGMGLTIIDSLDTMWLMGLTEEFKKARDWVGNSLDIVGNHRTVNLFETNIRVMGGLLAAYHLSNDKIFLQKAVSGVSVEGGNIQC